MAHLLTTTLAAAPNASITRTNATTTPTTSTTTTINATPCTYTHSWATAAKPHFSTPYYNTTTLTKLH